MKSVGRLVLLALCLGGLLGSGLPEAWAHRRVHLPRGEVQAVVPAARQPGKSVRPGSQVQTGGLMDAEALLAQAQAQEKAGNLSAAADTLIQCFNLFPHHAQAAEALLTAAALAQQDRRPGKALKVYTLVSSLYPETHMASQARLEAMILSYRQAAAADGALKSFRQFLQAAVQVAGLTAEKRFQEACLNWWQTVVEQVQGPSPCPVPVLEDLLGLWELTPNQARPPAARVFIGGLLRQAGLWKEAAVFLEGAGENGAVGDVKDLSKEVSQTEVPQAAPGDAAAFGQDRLGVSHWKNQSLEAAQEIYQSLEKEGDGFWQLLARTRLLDLEMARLRAASSP